MDSSSLLTLQAAQTQTATSQQKKTSAAVLQAASGTDADKATDKTSGKSNAKLGLDFETMCLSNLLSPMFEGLQTDGPFGGGEGEEAMRSFYVDAIAKQMAQRGGLGISDMMQKQLLQMQEQGHA
ncbi:MAG: rod-binding protein [Asticcacaulis sp.]|uniref:rod-binding protein n=1 Tax=Asticcacaulis sp. TaxID=1872648 RepID=UPI0039E35D43